MKIFHECTFHIMTNTRLLTEDSDLRGYLCFLASCFVCRDCCLQFYSISINFQEESS